jgi:hypothetical protein
MCGLRDCGSLARSFRASCRCSAVISICNAARYFSALCSNSTAASCPADLLSAACFKREASAKRAEKTEKLLYYLIFNNTFKKACVSLPSMD